MRKFILAGVTLLLFVGAIAFAYSNSNDSSICPNRPGCICTKETAEKNCKAEGTKETCPNRPGCICTK